MPRWRYRVHRWEATDARGLHPDRLVRPGAADRPDLAGPDRRQRARAVRAAVRAGQRHRHDRVGGRAAQDPRPGPRRRRPARRRLTAVAERQRDGTPTSSAARRRRAGSAGGGSSPRMLLVHPVEELPRALPAADRADRCRQRQRARLVGAWASARLASRPGPALVHDVLPDHAGPGAGAPRPAAPADAAREPRPGPHGRRHPHVLHRISAWPGSPSAPGQTARTTAAPEPLRAARRDRCGASCCTAAHTPSDGEAGAEEPPRRRPRSSPR